MKGLISKIQICVLCTIVVGCILTAQIHRESRAVMMPVNQKIVVLDAGHGGWDPGKTGSGTPNQDEKDINLKIMEKVQNHLEQGGATVFITRATDEALGESKRTDMKERTRIAEENQGDVLISIHQNAFPSASAKGAQVFYHASSEEGKKLAEVIQAKLCETVDAENKRQAKSNDDYYVLRTTKMPAIIVECGFLSNAKEEKALNDEAYQDKIAWAIYMGVLDYFSDGI